MSPAAAARERGCHCLPARRPCASASPPAGPLRTCTARRRLFRCCCCDMCCCFGGCGGRRKKGLTLRQRIIQNRSARGLGLWSLLFRVSRVAPRNVCGIEWLGGSPWLLGGEQHLWGQCSGKQRPGAGSPAAPCAAPFGTPLPARRCLSMYKLFSFLLLLGTAAGCAYGMAMVNPRLVAQGQETLGSVKVRRTAPTFSSAGGCTSRRPVHHHRITTGTPGHHPHFAHATHCLLPHAPTLPRASSPVYWAQPTQRWSKCRA